MLFGESSAAFSSDLLPNGFNPFKHDSERLDEELRLLDECQRRMKEIEALAQTGLGRADTDDNPKTTTTERRDSDT